MANTVVIGSINLDMVTEVESKPVQGQTILGERFSTFFGGKGANQAVALSRLGENVQFIGCVGNDTFADQVLNNLKENKIDTNHVDSADCNTGLANIIIENNDNSIIVIPGANNEVSIDLIEKHKDVILASDLVLMQFEIPFDTVKYVIELCSNTDVKIVLNPAPSREIDIDLIEKVDYFIPNSTEVLDIFKVEESKIDDVLRRYPNKLIVTLGEHGAKYFDGENIKQFKPNTADVVDTTGAGDTFVGSFCYCINNGKNIDAAIRFAMTASELAISKLGAQAGIPTYSEVENRLKKFTK